MESHSFAFSVLFSYAFPTLATKSFTVSHRSLKGKKNKKLHYTNKAYTVNSML